jgi:hypothetical protein
MTVTTTITSAVATGNGATTAFPFSFMVASAEDVKVYLYEIDTEELTLVSSANYSVEIDVETSTGSVTYVPSGIPLTASYKLLIVRDTPLVQPIQLTNQTRYYPDVVMSGFDRAVLLIQELKERLDRAIVAPPLETELVTYADVYSASAGASAFEVAVEAAAASALAAAESAAEAAAAVAPVTRYETVFVGDGETSFTLPFAPLANGVAIHIGGVFQVPGVAWSISDAEITFTEPLPASQITITAGGIPAVGFTNVSGFENFGAVGDGVEDDTSALVAAFAWLQGRPGNILQGTPEAVYRITSGIALLGDVGEVDWRGATLLCDGNFAALDAYNAPRVATLSANYVEGSTSLAVAAMSSAPTKGMKIKIHSDARDPANRDNGASGSQYRCGEWAVVGEGSTTTNIVLAAPLRHTVGIATGSGSRIAAYTTAMQAKVLLLLPGRFKMRNLVIRYSAGEAWSASAGGVSGYDGPELDSITYETVYGSAIGVQGNYGAIVRNVRSQDITTYGIPITGYGTIVDGAAFTSCRHAVTTAESTATVGTTNSRTMLSTGRVGGTIINNVTSMGGDLAPYDTHHAAEDFLLNNAVAEGGAGQSFAARGRGIVYNSPVARNCAKGVLGFTEFANDDSAPFLNGKTADDLTSLSVRAPQLTCVDEPLVCSGAFMQVAGPGRYFVQDHRLCWNNGGVMRISGSHYAVVSAGGGTNGSGCLQVDAASGDLGGIVSAALIVEEGADITIDARDADATGVYGLLAASGTSLLVKGRLTLLLPSTTTALLSGAGEITTEGVGIILYSVEGAADDSITLGAVGRSVRVKALDGTVDYDGAFGPLRLLYANTALEVAHTGTGSEVQGVYTPPAQELSTVMAATSGDWLRIVLHGDKEGASGTADLIIRSGGTNFVAQLVLPVTASLVQWVAEIDVLFRGDALQKYSIKFFTTDATATTTQFEVKNETVAAASLISAVVLGVVAPVGATVTIKACEVYGTRGGIL